jgi:hypothetical protein
MADTAIATPDKEFKSAYKMTAKPKGMHICIYSYA